MLISDLVYVSVASLITGGTFYDKQNWQSSVFLNYCRCFNALKPLTTHALHSSKTDKNIFIFFSLLQTLKTFVEKEVQYFRVTLLRVEDLCKFDKLNASLCHERGHRTEIDWQCLSANQDAEHYAL